MRWVFYLLLVLNTALFIFGLFYLRPFGEFELVEPRPINVKQSASMVLLLKENRLATTSEEPVEYSADLEFPKYEQKSRVAYREQSVAEDELNVKCYRLGPFRTKLDADTFHSKVDLTSGEWKIENQPENKEVSYWVYVTPSQSRDEALSVLRNLQVAGIDSYVVAKGDRLNAISLGTFKKRDSAEFLREKVAAIGFDVQVEERLQSIPSYWLYLQVQSDEDQRKVESKSSASLRSDIFSCEMFAQAEIIP